MRTVARTLVAALVALGCAGAPSARLDELPLRGAEACAAAPHAAIPPSDITFAIDASRSSRRPTGLDFDGDGDTGRLERGAATDRGDSMLAAQVSAVRSVLHTARAHDARFALLSYAGRRQFPEREAIRRFSAEEVSLYTEMTGEIARLEEALGRVLARGGDGNTDFSAAVAAGLHTHERASDALPGRRKLVLLISDSAAPVVSDPYFGVVIGAPLRSFPRGRLLGAVRRAQREGISFHTFAVGDAAAAQPPHPLSAIASTTAGRHYSVPDPSVLHCALLAALSAR